MRILAELVGSIILLLIFAYGVAETVEFISARKHSNGVPDRVPEPVQQPDPPTAGQPD